MKKIIHKSLLIVAILALPVAALAQDATGVWRTESTERGHIEVEISRCAAMLCGTIIGARDPSGQPGPYEHMGKRMIWDMKADAAAGSWSGGKIWDPRNGRSYNSRMSLENGRLKVAGCVLGICQSQTWQRVR